MMDGVNLSFYGHEFISARPAFDLEYGALEALWLVGEEMFLK
jgi:hypothetical protein